MMSGQGKNSFNSGVPSITFKGELAHSPYQGSITAHRMGNELIIKADVWCDNQSKPTNKIMAHVSRIQATLNGKTQFNYTPQPPYTRKEAMGLSSAVVAKVFEEQSFFEMAGVQKSQIDLNVCPSLLEKVLSRESKPIQTVKTDILKSPKEIALETFNRDSVKITANGSSKQTQGQQKIDIEQVLDFVRNETNGLSLLIVKLAITTKIKAIFGKMVNLQCKKNRWNITWNDPNEGAKNASVHAQMEEFSGKVREVLEANM